MSYDEMARRAALVFGPSAPSAADIATFVGQHMAGRCNLNRLRRDRELAEWMRQNASALGIDALRAACLAAFGPERTPSRSAIGRFLTAEAKRRDRARTKSLLARDGEVANWLREEAPQSTLNALLDRCERRFGAARTPSRTALSRFLSNAGIPTRSHRSRLAADPEVAGWAVEHARRMTLDELVAGSTARFGAERTPGRHAFHAFLAKASLASRKYSAERDPEVATWVREHHAGQTLDALLAALEARFGAARVPARSSLHRFVMAVRTAAYLAS